MSSDPTGPDQGEQAASTDEAREYLLAALRAARSAASQAGADPDAVTADLEDRLRRLRDELDALPDSGQ